MYCGLPQQIGTRGHAVVPAVNTALQFWTQSRQRNVQYIYRGEPLRTESYSAFRYVVEDADDERTALDEDLVKRMKSADKIIVCGAVSNSM
jgi:nicotinamidase-related amidase